MADLGLRQKDVLVDLKLIEQEYKQKLMLIIN